MQGKKKDRGAAAVEFALILPILITLLLGVMEFGYAMFVQATVAGAAREGARNLAIYQNTSSAVQAAVAAGQPAGVASSEVTPNASGCATGSASPGPVTVTIRHTYSGLGGLSWFKLPDLTITGEGVMRCGG